MSGGFHCKKCDEYTMQYKERKFVCTVCKTEEKVEPRKARCFRCGHGYDEYTWFDPSGCPNCRRSFVD